jgi:6-phosphogluconolactonase (cycloisomerase 2 family)
MERATNKIATFTVGATGLLAGSKFQASAGMQPFAFGFDPNGHMVVAEVGPGTPNGSSMSSYSLVADGTLTPITSALATNQTAACWLVTGGNHSYVANAASASITSATTDDTGAITLQDPSGKSADTGAGAIDEAVTPDNGYLYSLANGPHEIHIFEIGADGSLAAKPTLSGVPTTAAGLVAR